MALKSIKIRKLGIKDLDQSALDQDNRRSPETHAERNRPVTDYPVVQTVQKDKN